MSPKHSVKEILWEKNNPKSVVLRETEDTKEKLSLYKGYPSELEDLYRHCASILTRELKMRRGGLPIQVGRELLIAAGKER